MPATRDAQVRLELWTSTFCAPCRHARAVVGRAVDLVPVATLTEHDVARETERAQALAIRATPTLIVRDAGGAEIFRATGAPTLRQVLTAMAGALDDGVPVERRQRLV